MHETQQGKVYIHKDTEIKVISSEAINDYIAAGWKLGRTDTNRCYVHRGTEYKRIYSVYLEAMLAQGWEYGAAGKPRTKNK